MRTIYFEGIVSRLFPAGKYYKKKKIEYLNSALAFDIETTSFYLNGEKRATMYLWSFATDRVAFLGRTWEQFVSLINEISHHYNTSLNRRVVIYVHNLSFEFQFFRKWFDVAEVFASEKRKPIYILLSNGIEFRCSYFLTNLKLETVAENLIDTKIKKAVGDLDYKKMRNCNTKLWKKEKNYSYRDVEIVVAKINEEIKRCGNITKIPLTSTGYVRKYLKSKCCSKQNYSKYHGLIKVLTLSLDDYKQLLRAFQGGFTHANFLEVGRTVEDVLSYDFTSDYPAQICVRYFPMSAFYLRDVQNEDKFRFFLKKYCCLFDIAIVGLKPKLWQENPLSFSKCRKVKNPKLNNGRLLSADYLETTLTELDFDTLEKFYIFDDFQISNFKVAIKGYLPKEFVEAVLKLYADKTVLKGLDAFLELYMKSKGLLNSCYGCMVTAILRDEITYDGEWDESECLNPLEELEKYNNKKDRVLYYPWGVWVTAHARHEIFKAIEALGGDYLYSDTDSVKFKNPALHEDYFKEYNRQLTNDIKASADFHGIDINLFYPKTKKGIVKQLGAWDFDGHYKKFKTLGAKRYLTLDDKDNLNITVAGLGKSQSKKYLLTKYGTDGAFEAFTDLLQVPASDTGKLTHTYIDDAFSCELADYMGRTAPVYEKSCVHLEPATYDLSLSQQFIELLKEVGYV